MVIIFDFKDTRDEGRYQDFLEKFPDAIVVNEGDDEELSRAHRAKCPNARKSSMKGKRWAKFCFPDVAQFSDISDWGWIGRQTAPERCKVCNP